jgi:two-component system nitrate/nitrite response regulator NarL
MALQAPINVLCVDDHELLIEGLAARMALEPDINFVGRLPDAEDVVAKARELRANVILLDIDLPGVSPLDRLIDLRHALPAVKVLMLSAHIRDHYIDTALSRGAAGYFWKGDKPTAIIEGIRRAHSGRLAVSEEVSERLRGSSRAGTEGEGRSRLSLLSPRELEVLRLVGKGMSRADIARTFCRSMKTIDSQHTSIMKKLDIHDRAELTRFAIAEGLVEASSR